MSTAPAAGYLHHALLYETPAELLEVAVPFLAEGLAAGEGVVLSCRPEYNELLVGVLGRHDRVVVLTQGSIYTRCAAAIAAYRRVILQQVAAGVPRVRLVGEVEYGLTPEAWAQWTRYEAICNVALGPLPLSSVCAYESVNIPERMRRGVEQTHPLFLTRRGHVGNGAYSGPAAVLSQIEADSLDSVDPGHPTLRITGLTDLDGLAAVRARLHRALSDLHEHREACADFVTAVVELASNGLRHGRQPVEVLLWITTGRLMATVTDCGEGFDDPLAGYRPPDEAGVGMGLWLARQACDSLISYRGPSGFTVRAISNLATRKTPATGARLAQAEVAAARTHRARTRAERLLGESDERTKEAAARDERTLDAAEKLRRIRDDFGQRHR